MKINDRGSIKWGKSFIMPEHAQQLEQLFKEQTYKDKPILDEQQYHEFNLKLQLAIKDDLPIKIEYFLKRVFHTVEGHLLAINPLNNFLTIDTQKGTYKIILNDITDITFI